MSDERWTVADVAAFTGLSPSTVRANLARGRMPAPDARIDGRTPAWRPDTIRAWESTRATRKGK